MPIYLLAEIGVNHDGDVGRAAELIVACADAGFDGVKFQYWIVEELLAARVPTATYQGAGDQHELLAELALSMEQLAELKAVADRRGIEFVVTADGVQALRDILTLDPPRLKIGSGDADNPWLLEAAVDTGLPLLLSTGMMNQAEVQTAAARTVQAADVTVLHCVTSYPTRIDRAQLERLDELRRWTDRPVGLSDHTIGAASAAGAVALGAAVIEKHVTWSIDAIGPDHAASLPVQDARRFVHELRAIDRDLHSSATEESEAENRLVVRKALHTAKALPEGHVLTLDDLVPLRPLGDGIPAGARDDVVGRRLRRAMTARSVLRPKDLD